MQVMIELAALRSVSTHKWSDVSILMVSLFTSCTVGVFQEKSAQAAIDVLTAGLETKISAKPSGQPCYVSQ